MPGLWRREKALRLSPEPAIAIAGDDIIHDITQAAGEHGKTSEPAPWRPQSSKESQYGVGTRQAPAPFDHEKRAVEIGPVQSVRGGKRQSGIRPRADEPQRLVALMPKQKMNPGAAKHTVGVEYDLHGATPFPSFRYRTGMTGNAIGLQNPWAGTTVDALAYGGRYVSEKSGDRYGGR